MAASDKGPPREPLAGRKGPLKWDIDPELPKTQWLAPDGERAPARIRSLSIPWMGSERLTFYVYRGGLLLGMRGALADAKKLAETDKRDPSVEKIPYGNEGDIPAFLVMSKAERRNAMDKAPPPTAREMRNSWYDYKREQQMKGEETTFMSKYETMGVEELTREYNNSVELARRDGLDSFRQVPRFPDKDAALKALYGVLSSIRARQTSEKAVKQEARTKTGTVAREVIPTSQQPQKEEDKMAKKAKKAKKVAKKVAKKAGAKKAATPKGPKVYERPAGKAGEFTAKLGTRPDTGTDKLALFLFANLGKALPIDKVGKAVYGSEDANGLVNRVNDLRDKIDAAKVSYHIKREGGNIGLFTGSGK